MIEISPVRHRFYYSERLGVKNTNKRTMPRTAITEKHDNAFDLSGIFLPITDLTQNNNEQLTPMPTSSTTRFANVLPFAKGVN